MNGPDALDGIGAILARAHLLPDQSAFRCADLGLIDFDERQIAALVAFLQTLDSPIIVRKPGNP